MDPGGVLHYIHLMYIHTCYLVVGTVKWVFCRAALRASNPANKGNIVQKTFGQTRTRGGQKRVEANMSSHGKLYPAVLAKDGSTVV